MKKAVLIAAITMMCCQTVTLNAVENSARKTRTSHPGGIVPGELEGFGSGPTGHSLPDVGYNYYGHPGTGVMSSSMYPAPYPTPSISGHTMYTYQPLMPHEHMYQHSRDYYTPYAGPDAFYADPYGDCPSTGGYTKTSVRWQSSCNHFAPSPMGIYTISNIQTRLDRLRAKMPRFGCQNGNCR